MTDYKSIHNDDGQLDPDKIEPIGKVTFIKMDEVGLDEGQGSNIITPEKYKHPSKWGTVIAAGPKSPVKKGDRVYCSPTALQPIIFSKPNVKQQLTFVTRNPEVSIIAVVD